MAGIILLSCSFEIPTSISAKTNARYKFSIGEFDKDFGDKFDVTNIDGNLNSSGASETALYDYFPAGDNGSVNKYLLSMKLNSFTIDFAACAAETIFTAAGEDELDLNHSTLDALPDTIDASVDLDMFSTIIDELGTAIKYNEGSTKLSDSMHVKQIPVYIYLSGNKNFSGLGGKIYAYTDKGTKPAGEDLSITARPELPAENTEIVRTNLDLKPASYKESIVLESDATKLKVELENFNCHVKKGDSALGEVEFEIYAYIVLPFMFEVSNPNGIDIDVIKLAEKNDSDIMDRTKATDTADFDKYIDAIDSASVEYTSSKLPFNSASGIPLKIDLDGTGTKFENAELAMGGDCYEIQNVRDVFETYPLKPNAVMNIPSGTVSIPRDVKFVTNIRLNIFTNGEIEIIGGKK